MIKETRMTSSAAACASRRPSRRGLFAAAVAVAAVTLGLALGVPAPASAATAAPGWTLHSFAFPGNFSAADNAVCEKSLIEKVEHSLCDAYQVTATNAGGLESDGSPVTLTDTLPSGLTVKRVAFYWSGLQRALGLNNTTDLAEFGFCTTAPVQCSLPFAVAPDETLEMIVYVTVDEGTSGSLTNAATVSGGGAPTVSAPELANEISSTPLAFGASSFGSLVTGPDGRPDTQAGSHPYEFTTRIDLNSDLRIGPENAIFGATSVQDPRDIVVDLPLGFLGSALSAPQCTFAQLSSHVTAGKGGCPTDSVLGHMVTEPVGISSISGSLYNMVPEHGVAAEFGYVDVAAAPHVLRASVVPSPAGYVLRTTAVELPQIRLTDVIVTLFGNPAKRDASGTAPVPFFTNPSDCSGRPLLTTVHMDSWQSPGRIGADGQPDLSDPRWAPASSSSPAVTGCDRLKFEAAFSLKPDTTVADSPTGVDVDIKLPQPEDPGTLATPPLKKALVTLPAGFTVNPGAADGLGACSPAQIALASAAPPSCPDSSKIGTVELTSPLLPATLMGSIYLATQNDNPFNSLLAGYVVVDDPNTGIVVKIPGNLTPDPQTGQITGTFDNNPQFPFSELKLHFKGGPRGTLATPESCGIFTTTSALTPWSAPATGPAVTPSDSFPITSGCVSGFTPAFTAGTTNTQAGAYSPFVLSFSRSDSEEDPAGLTAALPTGLLGKIAGVAECSDAQVAAAAAQSGAAEQSSPSCPASSQLGSVQTGAGPGPSPFFVSGKAYLTGPYKGAPYGVAVIVPAVAGPFDLGTVVIRQALFIDPTDAHVTDVSDPFPTILKGIPLRIRRVDVTLDRQGFTFNPTSCEPKTVNATLTSIGGAHTPVSSRFQASGCSALAFKPAFAASTQGRTSKANGASLTVKLSQIPGEANIRKVNLQLPIALPSRLTTLQKACTEAQFNANPAGCPPGSFVGTAKAVTPVLATPLTGPAILVSHGGAAFPDVEFLLQSEGVQIVLDGKTQIKKGITYSHFETVPDAPISSFETILPQGPHSVLAANLPANAKASICGQKLVIPTTLTGQNGATLTQTTKIAVTGCPKAKTRAQKLAVALKACKKKPKAKRAVCAKQARKKYGPVKKTAKKK
jgi:hypothetical protein